jgi:multidrug resistance efflux pump
LAHPAPFPPSSPAGPAGGRSLVPEDRPPPSRATVDGIARGITDPDKKDGAELLANVNPNFTWVRLAQRIPVRIHLTEVPPGVLISAGMTCTVIVKDGASPQIGAQLKQLVSAVF